MINIAEISNSKFFTDAMSANHVEGERKQSTKIDKLSHEIIGWNKYREQAIDFNLSFGPFNLANRAFYSFIPFLKNKLRKGDAILDIGNTTGWSSAMLSALFPEQKIIRISEGAASPVGQDGPAYWFDSGTSNIETLFCNLNSPLPVHNKSVSLVFGTDILPQPMMTWLLQEFDRVANDDAIIVFTNIDPVDPGRNPPYEYDTKSAHGLMYAKAFGKLTDRKSYLFSEHELFRASNDKGYQAKTSPDMNYRNGLLALTNSGLDLEKELSVFNYFDYFNLGDGYLLPNPVLEADINGVIRVRQTQVEQQIEEHLKLHPAYAERISNTIGYRLSDEERILLYWAKKCRSCSFIQRQLKTDSLTLRLMIEKLQDLDILQILPLGSNHVRMQHYFAYQEFTEAPKNFNLKYLWQSTVASFPDKTYAIDRHDNASYTYKEFDEVIKYITSTLIQYNIGRGDKILLHADTSFEVIGLFWACMHLGIVFIPVNPSLPEMVTEGLIEKYNPKIIFLAHDCTSHQRWGDKIVFFDNQTETDSNSQTNKLCFSEWLKESQEIESLPEIDENDLGIILHTSGSTGIPKGVKLAHGQVWQGAINALKPYLMNENNTCVSISGLDSMGGFRSVCFSTIVGGTCIIPTMPERTNPAELLTCIYETEVHSISISPSLLNQLMSKKDAKARLAKMQCIMSVGSALTTQLKTEFFEKTDKRIFNCYGMTEAAGVLICEPLNGTNLKGGFIGSPVVDCIIKIVDENNNQVEIGEIGELHLYGYAAFRGYYSDTEPNPNDIQQWYVTGDLVKMNPDGSLELTGRKKDFMKNARGEIVYFSEIEEVLKPLPFISDLGLITFFQAESERGALFIELNSGLPAPKNIVEEIKKELTIKAGIYKIPAIIKVIEKIPRNKYGKLQKTELNQYL